MVVILGSGVVMQVKLSCGKLRSEGLDSGRSRENHANDCEPKMDFS